MSLRKEMDEFALKIINKASQDNTSLGDMVEAFKVLTPYHNARFKVRPKKGDPEDTEEPAEGGFTFGGDQHDGRGSAVPTRRDS